MLLVLEDAHWADGPTLGLLRHLARGGARARLLVLATFRDTDVPDALGETLADLRRSEDVVRLRLAGLTGDEVAELVRADAEIAGEIRELTGGNPFLVCELWRSFADTGELGTPESVREVVSGRLARLQPATGDLLELAATAGPEFELDVLRAAAGVEVGALLAALDEAVHSGMIEELRSVKLAYRFTHELVRRALYDALTAARRAELHLRVGEALERAGGAPAADLAHHFTVAAPLAGAHARRRLQRRGGARRGGGAGLRRGRRAAERRALARRRGPGRARAAADRARPDPQPRRSRGRRAAAYAEAAELAPDAELLAQAAIGYEETCWRPAIKDPLAVELLRRAAAALDPAAVAAARRRARRARPRAADGRPARARRRRPRRGGRDGARARRPRRALPRAGRELLVARDQLARRRCWSC